MKNVLIDSKLFYLIEHDHWKTQFNKHLRQWVCMILGNVHIVRAVTARKVRVSYLPGEVKRERPSKFAINCGGKWTRLQRWKTAEEIYTSKKSGDWHGLSIRLCGNANANHLHTFSLERGSEASLGGRIQIPFELIVLILN